MPRKLLIAPESIDLNPVGEEKKSDNHSVLETNPDTKVKAQLEKERRLTLQKQKIEGKMDFVHPFHKNFNLVFNIMVGIKKSVDATLDIPMYKPTDKDYKIRCL